MVKTANDITDKIAAQTEELITTAQTEIRRYIANELADLIKGSPDRVADNLQVFLSTDKPYLATVDVDTWKPTPDFLQGIRFAIAALRDKDFDY